MYSQSVINDAYTQYTTKPSAARIPKECFENSRAVNDALREAWHLKQQNEDRKEANRIAQRQYRQRRAESRPDTSEQAFGANLETIRKQHAVTLQAKEADIQRYTATIQGLRVDQERMSAQVKACTKEIQDMQERNRILEEQLSGQTRLCTSLQQHVLEQHQTFIATRRKLVLELRINERLLQTNRMFKEENDRLLEELKALRSEAHAITNTYSGQSAYSPASSTPSASPSSSA